MANLRDTLSDEKKEEIKKFLVNRFAYFEKLRKPFDDEIKEDVDITNNIDKNMALKQDWEEKVKVPYIYTIIQTMVARIVQTLFGRQNWLKIYGEEEPAKKIEKAFTRFAQAECDKLKIKSRARDFIEDALSERTNWISIWPVQKKGNEKFRIEMGVYSWYDVWWDTMAKSVEESDFFIRKIVKFWKIKQHDEIYFNIEKIEKSIPPEDLKEKQKYEAKNSEVTYYDPAKNNVTDKTELLEWRGFYDLSEDKDSPKFEPVIFVLANREILCRVETIELKTRRKILIFPIRPLRQAKTLIGKSVPQLIKDTQYELNETRSLRLQNFKLQIKLLFKYRKDSGIDLDDLFAKGGNAIGFEDSPTDITPFDIPNMIAAASHMSTEQIQIMQQILGATDYVMGTSAGKGITETASGIKQITEQALFKFHMMSENMYDDLMELINFIIILKIKYDLETVLIKYPAFKEFIEAQTEEDLEDSHLIDIAIRDLSVRRDIARAQFINASNIILPMLEKTGGNITEYLRQVMDRMDMENIDDIVNPPPEIQQMLAAIQANPQIIQLIQTILSDPSGKLLQQITQVLSGIAGGAGVGVGVPAGAGGVVAPGMRASRPEEEVGMVPEVRT